MAQAVEPVVPERLVAIEPLARGGERAGLEAAAHDAARLLAFDEARALEDREVLDEPGQRHGVRLRQVPHGLFALAKPCEHRASRRIGQRAEHVVERTRLRPALIVNHLVHFSGAPMPCQPIGAGGRRHGAARAHAADALPGAGVPGRSRHGRNCKESKRMPSRGHPALRGT